MIKRLDNLVYKYINGYDIPEDIISELESNIEFMKEVLKKTKDKNMYKLCSIELKQDYNFIKFLVETFEDDHTFIISVANEYIEEHPDTPEEIELSIILLQILMKKDLSAAAPYKILVDSKYEFLRFENELLKNGFYEDLMVDDIGMGFNTIFDQYKDYKIILNYYAKLAIDEIINSNSISLEKLLHAKFKTPDELQKIGIEKYLIGLISIYDEFLSLYVNVNKSILEDYKEQIEKIISYWDEYIIKDEKEKYLEMYSQVHDYLYDKDSNISEFQYIEYIGRELGILDKLLINLKIGQVEDEYLENYYDMIRFEIENNAEAKRNYLNVKRIMINILFKDIIPESGDEGRQSILRPRFNV